MNRIERENEGRNIVEFTLVSLTPCFCTSETGFLGTGENNAKLRVFKLNTLILESLKESNTHIAAAEIIVCTVNNTSVIYHEIKTYKERNKYETDEACFTERR